MIRVRKVQWGADQGRWAAYNVRTGSFLGPAVNQWENAYQQAYQRAYGSPVGFGTSP